MHWQHDPKCITMPYVGCLLTALDSCILSLTEENVQFFTSLFQMTLLEDGNFQKVIQVVLRFRRSLRQQTTKRSNFEVTNWNLFLCLMNCTGRRKKKDKKRGSPESWLVCYKVASDFNNILLKRSILLLTCTRAHTHTIILYSTEINARLQLRPQ